jgi:glucose-1-phosphate thymidylyltransferase
VVPPVDIGDNVTLTRSVVGPNVSLDDGVTIEDSVVQDSIVGRDASLTDVNLQKSIIGDAATVHGEPRNLNVGDNSDLSL